MLVDYPESKFGGFLAVTDYKDPVILDEIKSQRLGHLAADPLLLRHHQQGLPARQERRRPLPRLSRRRRHGPSSAPLCDAPPDQLARFKAIGNRNWLGTDDQGRDVVARVIYGFRISVLFGLLLTIFSSVIGVTAGAVQGYFGGRVDLVFQRFLEIWSSIPSLFVLIIISSVLVPGFWTLLGMLLLFQWVNLVGVVRAEFLRGAQLRIRHGGARARPVQRQDHVQAPAAERDGGDADLPAVQAVGLRSRR